MEKKRNASTHYIDEMLKYVIYEPHSFVIDIKKSHGMWLATVDGDEIFDWAGYYGAKLIGHNHPRLFEPDYVNDLVYAANNKIANPDFLTPECVAYYRKLHALAPRCMKNEQMEVYAVNSGAEAVENMMKYFINLFDSKCAQKGVKPKAHRFIYFDKAFHGRTMFALNITRIPHDPIATRNFEHIFEENIQIPFPELNTDLSEAENTLVVKQTMEAIEHAFKQYPDEIVAVIVEPIQGSGGHRMAQHTFFQQLSELTHRYDVSLGFDEVQTAGGQTGTFFAIDSFDLPYPPQAVSSGKKLGNGILYMQQPMKDIGILDSTWGGTLSDMVRFIQEMKIVEEANLMAQVPEKSAYFVAKLTGLKEKYAHLIYNVRGMGIYQGFSLVKNENKGKLISTALNDENLLLLGAGLNSIRFRPVLDVTIADIDLLCEKLDRCLAKMN